MVFHDILGASYERTSTSHDGLRHTYAFRLSWIKCRGRLRVIFVFCRLILHELLDRGRLLFDSSILIPLGAQQFFLSLSGALSKPELVVEQRS